MCHYHLISCSLVVLQSDVQPQASLMEGAPSKAGRLRGAPQKRAVRNSDWADQSEAFPAGWRSHFLHDGSGDHISSFQHCQGLLYKWAIFKVFEHVKNSLEKQLFMSHFLNSESSFLFYRSSQRWRAVWTSSAVFTMCSDSPSSFTSPLVQRSIWVTSLCGTRLRR